MDEQAIITDIKKLVLNSLWDNSSIQAEDVQLGWTLTGGELCFDSLDVVEFMMDVEDHFDICIPDADIEKHFTTVGKVIDYVKEKTK